MLHRVFSCAAILFAAVSLSAASQGGSIPLTLPLFPGNNWWNTDITNAPVDPNSATYLSVITARMTNNANQPPTIRGLHPDFGGDAGGGDVYGIPFIQVDGTQAKKTVIFDDTPEESDGVNHTNETSFPFYPIPDQAITQNGWVEGGQPGNVDQRSDSDRHILIVDTTNNDLYELWNCFYDGTSWHAGSGAFFDMDTNNRRTDGWTSADAAGLAILPGLVRYDEAFGSNEIGHAFRVTLQNTNGYVYPASHVAGSTAGALPMGARLRLKDINISSYTPEVQRIFRAMKKYGLIVADNGSDMYVSGTYDVRWDNGVLNPAFNSLKASDFEVIQLGWKPTRSFIVNVPAAVGSGDATTGTVTAYDANYNVATSYTGTVHFTSSDGAATLPANYTFIGADAGTHTFSGGFMLRTTGGQSITATDTLDATSKGIRYVAVGPPTPTAFTATGVSATQVNLGWVASAGATQYQVYRATSGNSFTLLGTTAGTTYPDTTVTANNAYAYKVRAVDASSRTSGYTTPEVATTFTFTDDPIVAALTVAKGVHLTELRNAVNALRTVAGLGAATFTDAAIVSGTTTAKAVHITELRTALNAARTTLGMPAASFTTPSLTAGNTIQGAHVQELRTALK